MANDNFAPEDGPADRSAPDVQSITGDRPDTSDRSVPDRREDSAGEDMTVRSAGTGAAMGTTATPDVSGAAAIDQPDSPNGADGVARTGGAVDDPDLPFDRRPGPDDPVHRSPRYGQR